MAVLARCPTCEKGIKIPRRGITGKCPHCESRIKVPLQSSQDDPATTEFFAAVANSDSWKESSTSSDTEPSVDSKDDPVQEQPYDSSVESEDSPTSSISEPFTQQTHTAVDSLSDDDVEDEVSLEDEGQGDPVTGVLTDSLSVAETNNEFHLDSDSAASAEPEADADQSADSPNGTDSPETQTNTTTRKRRRPSPPVRDSTRRPDERNNKRVVDPGFRRGSYASKLSIQSILSLQFLSRNILKVLVFALLAYSIVATAGITYLYFYR